MKKIICMLCVVSMLVCGCAKKQETETKSVKVNKSAGGVLDFI